MVFLLPPLVPAEADVIERVCLRLAFPGDDDEEEGANLSLSLLIRFICRIAFPFSSIGVVGGAVKMNGERRGEARKGPTDREDDGDGDRRMMMVLVQSPSKRLVPGCVDSSPRSEAARTRDHATYI